MIRNDKKGVLMAKTIQTPTDVVRCEWSGNRANAWDTDGNKRTSEITVGARQKAADGGYMLGRFEMKTASFNGGDTMVKYLPLMYQLCLQ